MDALVHALFYFGIKTTNMPKAFISELKQGIAHLFYPVLCEGCKQPLVAPETILCISCLLEMPQTKYHNLPNNDTALLFAGRIPFINATTYAWFTNDGLLQLLLHGLKYKGKKEIGVFLGQQFALSLLDTDWIHTIDLIIPVPLHPKKKAIRGYNQSMMIANGISNILKKPATEEILFRIKHTESQTNKSRTERLKNMEGAFKINPLKELKNTHILLCDDVLTTGATLEACANILLLQENIKISIATVGIAVS